MSTLTLDDSLEGQKGRQTLLRHFRPLDKSYYYDQDVLDHINESIHGRQDNFGNDVYCLELIQGPSPPDSFLFMERIISMISTVFTEEYFLANYPNCDIDIILAYNAEPGQSIADLQGIAGCMVNMQAMLQKLLAYNERNTPSPTQL